MKRYKEYEASLVKISIYGWKNLLFQILVGFVILMVSTLLGGFKIAIIYLPVIMLTRLFIKSPHLTTRFKCFIISVLVNTIMIYFALRINTIIGNDLISVFISIAIALAFERLI